MPGTMRLLRVAAAVSVLVLVTAAGYRLQAKPLTTGLVDLLLVMAIAFRWGFVEAAFASLGAVAFLDFFYMPPILSFYEEDPQDWISTAIFLLISFFVSRFADRLRRQTADAENERTRLERLFLTSRDIILMDRRQEAGAQLAGLIEHIFKIDAVAIWDARGPRMDKAGRVSIPEDEVRATYFNEVSEDDASHRSFRRVLRLGTRPVGALYIAASSEDRYLDARSVDALASLTALALERAHSFLAESQAEAARRSEQLRSTVLDGLAHAFKTPLATIQTASSGLLEIPELGQIEKELASLIEEESERLAALTEKVLQTAELDTEELKVRSEKIELARFLEQCRDWLGPALGDHALNTVCAAQVKYGWADSHLLQMALLQLVDNASKYARPNTPITLGVASTDSEIVFSVRNEGSFIPPEEQFRIFDRFYRIPDAQYTAAGTGIGLSVTKRIAESHRGRVWVESHPDGITTFHFALPQVRKAE